ncbi:hypothetical protein QC762_0104640 [Podospora pseudocomata]|uniref:Extracellular membrane protein CFEM domain-containing protein n=1 Tax=Podospora pseudocomata TaxID=2093779 RepID=A0ABR0G2P1_9PEZI|nr:hypothetical protein QC762_0104640 [Podospora pseudocomata]
MSTLKMKSFNICLAIAVIRSTIVAAIGDTIPCICNSGLLKGNGGDCNQWCGDACLKYLREELLIMDLAHCLDSTIKLEVSAIAAAKAFAKFHRSLEVTRPGRKRIDGNVTFGAEDLGWSSIPVEYSSPHFNAVTSMTTR